MANGADVSEWQGALPSSWFAQHDFVIIRGHSGYRDDLQFSTNWRNARGHTKRGIYGYVVPDRDPAAQARRLRELTADDPPELGYWCDAEEPGLDVEHVLAHLRALGDNAGLYTYVPFLRSALGNDERLRAWPLWIAGYGPNDGDRHDLDPDAPWPWAIHQYTSKPLDLNYAPTLDVFGPAPDPEDGDMRSMLIHAPGSHAVYVYDAAAGTKTLVASAEVLDGMKALAPRTGLICDGPHNGAHEATQAFVDGLVDVTGT